MNEELKHKLLNIVGKELISKGFYLAVNAKKYLIFHRKTESYIEIIQFAKERNETYFLVSSSIVYTKVSSEYSNICYQAFKECNDGDINKISVDDCFKKYFLKGDFGGEFHYGDVYISIGNGRIGVSPTCHKKPCGIRIKKYKENTYDNLCRKIIKNLYKIYNWLDKQKRLK